jgi:arginine decarboxylase
MNKQMINQARAPLYEALVAHYNRRTASFHVPGHKSGQGVDQEAKAFFDAVMSIDYTEITGLDDLHQAEGVILEAQRLAADCFGAEETFFLVGGSTVGNLAMITALCEKDDLLLVQRDVHKSVINGITLAGAKAVFLSPVYDPSSGITTGIRLDEVEKALHVYPEAKGLLVTTPNYHGIGVDLQGFADLVHSHGKPLLVDEAHGAHYGFHRGLPPSALSCGADIVVQSTHKMLTAMTMGAMLHVQGHLINREMIRDRLAMLQSSSPSYPILASLDLARRQLHLQGEDFIERGLTAVNGFLQQLELLGCYGHINEGLKDPFKISIYDKSGTLLGPVLRTLLEEKGCYVEMADMKHVLLLFTPASTVDDVQRLFHVLTQIAKDYDLSNKAAANSHQVGHIFPAESISEPVSFQWSARRDQDNDQLESIPVQDAIGRHSAEMVVPYPPGIPILYPGERIRQETAEYLVKLVELGIKFHGTLVGQSGKLKVYGK